MLGVVSAQLGRHRAAVECIGRALALRPDWPDAHNNLGNVQRERGSLDQAIACYRRALELKPDHPEFLANLANVLGDRGELDEAVASYRRAGGQAGFRRGPQQPPVSAPVSPRRDLGRTRRRPCRLRPRHARPLQAAWRPHENTRDPARCLRLGFVSADLGQHPVGAFLIRVLENLDPTNAKRSATPTGLLKTTSRRGFRPPRCSGETWLAQATR